jgi:hypothetical protein
MASVKIRVSEDGTFAVYRDGTAIVSNLTRAQAERFVTVLGWISLVA